MRDHKLTSALATKVINLIKAELVGKTVDIEVVATVSIMFSIVIPYVMSGVFKEKEGYDLWLEEFIQHLRDDDLFEVVCSTNRRKEEAGT